MGSLEAKSFHIISVKCFTAVPPKQPVAANAFGLLMFVEAERERCDPCVMNRKIKIFQRVSQFHLKCDDWAKMQTHLFSVYMEARPSQMSRKRDLSCYELLVLLVIVIRVPGMLNQSFLSKLFLLRGEYVGMHSSRLPYVNSF